MSLPIITASQLSTNEPDEVVSFDRWWIEHLLVNGNQDGNLNGTVILAKFGTKNDGSMVFSGEKTTLHINDILNESANNQILASAISSIIQYVGEKAVQEGKASGVSL